MPKIVSQLFISLDGVVEAPDQWHFPYFTEEMAAAVNSDYGRAETLLLGRRTYDSFAGAWPAREAAGGEDAGFAARLGDLRKVVLTHHGADLGWRNAEPLVGDVMTAVTALRDAPGEGIVLVPGSVGLVRTLITLALLDELHLLVHPVAVRNGETLFDHEGASVPLRLVSSEVFTTGVLDLRYALADAPTPAGYDEAKQHLSRA